MAPLPTLLREIHRLRKLIRDLQAEIDRGPRVLKAHQANLAKQDQAYVDAQDLLKKLRAETLTSESAMKSAQQQLKKYEDQLGQMTTSREVELKEAEIAFVKGTIAALEEEILGKMFEIESRTTNLPEIKAKTEKVRADFATYQSEAKTRLARLTTELKSAQADLQKKDLTLPAAIRSVYERLVKSYGADALASVQESSCGHCRTKVAGSAATAVEQGEFATCQGCGRGLYAI